MLNEMKKTIGLITVVSCSVSISFTSLKNNNKSMKAIDWIINNENIFFVNDNNLDSWTNRIETILTNTKLKDTVSTNGNKTTLEHYDSDYFYKSLIKIIFRS